MLGLKNGSLVLDALVSLNVSSDHVNLARWTTKPNVKVYGRIGEICQKNIINHLSGYHCRFRHSGACRYS